MSAPHRLKDETLEQLQKRPTPMSTDARTVRPIFGEDLFKLPYISCAINDYNYFMDGVDRANQLRRNLTANRPCEHCALMPLWYYLLHICAINSGLIWQKSNRNPKTAKAKRGQRPFCEALIDALLSRRVIIQLSQKGNSSLIAGL